jgi:hypothetical protein
VTANQEAFERNPQKSVRSVFASTSVQNSKMKLHKHAYKIQVTQMLQEEDYRARLDFYQQIRSKITESHEFLEELTFSDEANFHISGKVKGSVWGREKPQEVWQHGRDSPKLNEWCAYRKSYIICPFFFNEATVDGKYYRVIL